MVELLMEVARHDLREFIVLVIAALGAEKVSKHLHKRTKAAHKRTNHPKHRRPHA